MLAKDVLSTRVKDARRELLSLPAIAAGRRSFNIYVDSAVPGVPCFVRVSCILRLFICL